MYLGRVRSQSHLTALGSRFPERQSRYLQEYGLKRTFHGVDGTQRRILSCKMQILHIANRTEQFDCQIRT
jgi:hypothetical protein